MGTGTDTNQSPPAALAVNAAQKDLQQRAREAAGAGTGIAQGVWYVREKNCALLLLHFCI